VRVRSEHYDALLPESWDAQDTARLLEAAWDAMAEDLGATPAVQAPLELGVYPSREAWAQALRLRGIPVPSDAGGYYDPGTRFASLYAQPTLYFSEMLLLHEAYHQFHLLARTATAPLPTWYVEGLAEWASRHDWDGACVRLGADPRASFEDYWATALQGLDTRGSDLAAWTAGDSFPGRPEMMAFVHAQERAQAEAWGAYRAGTDFGAGGTLPRLADEDFRAHVEAFQEPLTPVWLDWLHRTPDTMDGVAPGTLSAVRYKQRPSALRFTATLDGAAYVGGLIGWSAEGFDVLLVDPAGEVSRWVSSPSESGWSVIGQLPARPDVLRWEQDPDGVRLDGQRFAFTRPLPPAAGFVLYDGAARFTTLGEE
jgi:hypothetical protein